MSTGNAPARTEAPWWALRYEALAELDAALLGTIDDRAEAEVEFIAKLLELGEGERILDVACGSGRHGILLQEAGHQVTGIDLSPRVLRMARETWDARHRGERGPTWMPGDMRWLPTTGPHDAALLLDHSFGLFDDDAEHLRVLSSLCDTLRPGGRLLLQLHNPYYWASRPTTMHFAPGTLTEESDVIRSYRFDIVRGRLEERTVVLAMADRAEPPVASVRTWTPAEIASLLRGAGFRRIRVHGSEGFDVPEEPMPPQADDCAWLWVSAVL